MTKAKVNLKSNWKEWLKVIIIAVLGILCGAGVDLAIRPTNTEEVIEIEAKTTLELAEEQVDATIINEEGQVEIVELPTVESVDGGELTDECGEDEECGQGWYVRTDTIQHFVDDTYGQCIDTDGHYGSQCWDLANLFWQNYAGRNATTCGYGSAKAMSYDECKEKNAGSEFTIIYDKTQLQPGDWIITDAGLYGHVNVALGYYNNGYISAYGTNQSGKACSGGGSASNIINFGLGHFVLAFRPNSYIVEEEPEPEPTVIPVTGCDDWNVKSGDTMIGIGIECENVVMNTEQVNAYAATWWSQIYNKGHSVYYGWTHGTGYGLYAGDYIIHDTEGKYSE